MGNMLMGAEIQTSVGLSSDLCQSSRITVQGKEPKNKKFETSDATK